MRDIKTLDLNLLRTLDALLDERSVTRAAERLGFTQPAVSGMLIRLRESFDDPLFVRTQRGIVPTLRATELAGPIKQILNDVDTLLQPAVFNPLSARFTLSIAATDYALQTVVLPFMVLLRQRAPGIRVAMRPVEDDRVQTQFERGDLDLALMTPEAACRISMPVACLMKPTSALCAKITPMHTAVRFLSTGSVHSTMR